MSAHDEPDQAHLSEEEIRTAVIEAARFGRPVMSHAYGGEGLSTAVRAGVRSIEHGLLLTEEQAAEIAAAGCWLVPTLSIVRDLVSWGEAARAGEPSPLAERPEATAKALELRSWGETVRIAKAAGVPTAIGTDYVTREQHGRNLGEIRLMHEAGLTVEEALFAATMRGAELCGVADRFGRIAPGYVFDAILLDDDPGDLSGFSEPGVVTGVFKGGVAAVPHPRLVGSPSDVRI